MAWISLKTIRTLLARINGRRIWPFLIFAFTGTLAMAAWLGWPFLLSNPYVRVSSSSFLIYSDCIPKKLHILTRTPYATLTRARLVLHDGKTRRFLAQYDLQTDAIRLDEGPQFVVNVPEQAVSQLQDAKSNYHKHGLIGVALDFTKIPAIDVVSTSFEYEKDASTSGCKDHSLGGTALADRLDDPRARVMRFYLIQEKLSDLIFLVNEILGNILLAALSLMVLWLAGILFAGLRGIYLISDQTLTASLKSNAETAEFLAASYSKMYRRLVFGRVLGPALGFLLTISSLIAGLHPSVTAARDTFQFITSLQLALVATFMGLLVRIIAEFALRFQRELAERSIALAS